MLQVPRWLMTFQQLVESRLKSISASNHTRTSSWSCDVALWLSKLMKTNENKRAHKWFDEMYVMGISEENKIKIQPSSTKQSRLKISGLLSFCQEAIAIGPGLCFGTTLKGYAPVGAGPGRAGETFPKFQLFNAMAMGETGENKSLPLANQLTSSTTPLELQTFIVTLQC